MQRQIPDEKKRSCVGDRTGVCFRSACACSSQPPHCDLLRLVPGGQAVCPCSVQSSRRSGRWVLEDQEKVRSPHTNAFGENPSSPAHSQCLHSLPPRSSTCRQVCTDSCPATGRSSASCPMRGQVGANGFRWCSGRDCWSLRRGRQEVQQDDPGDLDRCCCWCPDWEGNLLTPLLLAHAFAYCSGIPIHDAPGGRVVEFQQPVEMVQINHSWVDGWVEVSPTD